MAVGCVCVWGGGVKRIVDLIMLCAWIELWLHDYCMYYCNSGIAIGVAKGRMPPPPFFLSTPFLLNLAVASRQAKMI